VAPSREESVFALMDAVAEGRGRDAFGLLRQMLYQGEAPLGIMALLARQVRVPVLGRDTLDAGGGPDRLAAAAGGLHPYVARRMLGQARAFAEPDLEAALEAVWEAEWAVKSGRLDEESALLDVVARLLAARSRAG
jgi:DNA polymerase-3 subunit delta